MSEDFMVHNCLVIPIVYYTLLKLIIKYCLDIPIYLFFD